VVFQEFISWNQLAEYRLAKRKTSSCIHRRKRAQALVHRFTRRDGASSKKVVEAGKIPFVPYFCCYIDLYHG
jgi:hypothetical protein